ncbi:hypothetical protein TTHERM_000214829 (macronuclear) [Tetrahymena thermophila SB210]|uniref:Uncharacterized protein n=1 Tax=Tetrahymena thermophila (strain SB210) TaxID=312017 RepID=W7XHF5_TETTS|nr:hypothetical protein TTHERM_000214829 [Tetrahymena thermophila SB210]EWS76678.1 hypothetical protein TTHERM_000214829 [Tetrahymena thermophila SB210]|eukprot:XP_012650846.1 hypothetical protein TTHERM_000214829 [Tetrahymena thermophila SB210]
MIICFKIYEIACSFVKIIRERPFSNIFTQQSENYSQQKLAIQAKSISKVPKTAWDGLEFNILLDYELLIFYVDFQVEIDQKQGINCKQPISRRTKNRK